MLQFNLLRYGALVGEIALRSNVEGYCHVTAQNLAVTWGQALAENANSRVLLQINPKSGNAKRLVGAPILLACNRVRA